MVKRSLFLVLKESDVAARQMTSKSLANPSGRVAVEIILRFYTHLDLAHHTENYPLNTIHSVR